MKGMDIQPRLDSDIKTVHKQIRGSECACTAVQFPAARALLTIRPLISALRTNPRVMLICRSINGVNSGSMGVMI